MQKQIAVVIDADHGIGRATLPLLAEQGFDLALVGHDPESLDNARAALDRFDIRVLTAAVDITDSTALDRTAEDIEEKLGPITLWINAAGIFRSAPVLSLDATAIETITRVNYLSAVHGTRAALRVMRRRGVGRIINVGLAPHAHALPFLNATLGAQAALKGFCDSVQSEIRALSDRIALTIVPLPGMNTSRCRWRSFRITHPSTNAEDFYDTELAARAIARAVSAHHGRLTSASPAFSRLFNAVMPRVRDACLPRRGAPPKRGERSQSRNLSPRHDNDSAPTADATRAPSDPGVVSPAHPNGPRPVTISHAVRYILGSVVTLGLFYMFGYAMPLRFGRGRTRPASGRNDAAP